MELRKSGMAYYTDSEKFVQQTPGSFVMPLPGQPGLTWVPQYVNGAAVFVPAYTAVSGGQPYPYYPQPTYGPYRSQGEGDYYQPPTYPYAHHMDQHTVGFHVYGDRFVTTNSGINSVTHESAPLEMKQKSQNHQNAQAASEPTYSIPKHTSKRCLSRYDSDDSGIAESPRSLTSSVTWSGDESTLDYDSSDLKVTTRHASSASDQSSGSNDDKSDFATTCDNKSPDCNDNNWTISDDNLYWSQFRQQIPPSYIINAIAKQVDYYLCDDYLVKDKYLLRQIRCKKDGYISIKLITSFKKVKKLTRDWAVVRSAIVRKSNTIVVSSEGLRIRRKTNLSEDLRKPRLLTSVLVIRLSEEYDSVERVTSLFGSFGEISYVRLLRTDKEIPADLRNYATQVHDIGVSLCAIVDFENPEDALTSVRFLKYFQRQTDHCDEGRRESDDVIRDDVTHEKDDLSAASSKYNKILTDLPQLGDMRLALLGPRVRRTLYRQDRVGESVNYGQEQATHKQPNHAVSNQEEPLTRRLHESDPKQNSKPHLTQDSLIGRPGTSYRRSGIVTSSNRQCYVIRQPKGPEESKGFKIKRSINK